MVKLKQPIISLGASGTLADSLTFQRLRTQDIVRKKPIPTDRRTLEQVYQRWDYQDYAAMWSALSAAEKRSYQSQGVRYHLTGYAFWMRTMLRSLSDVAGRWRLDEQTGSLARDSSKNSNDGVISGASSVDGVIGHARSFDGIDDKITIVDTESLHLDDEITIECFITPQVMTGGSATRIICAKESWHWCLRIQRDLSNLAFNVRTLTLLPIVWWNNALTAGRTYHVAGVYNRQNVIIYVDGVPVVGEAATDALKTNTDPFVWGVALWDATRQYKGVIDNSVVYNRALSQTEIVTHSRRRYP